MKCLCGNPTHVLATRKTADGQLRRRRECKVCGKRYTTVETAVELPRGRPKTRTGTTLPAGPQKRGHGPHRAK